jgi:CheY-like chemotaxis protein
VLMDLRMPGIGGLETIRRLRTGGSTAAIFAISASGLADTETEARDAGVEAFVRKPYRESDLLATIGERLGVRYDYGVADARANRAATIAAGETTHRPSILVVDDTHENLRLLDNMLREEGFEVRSVSSGRQALQAIEHDPPDLIMLDVNMPDMDGYEVCRRLRAHEPSRDVPVIFLTAWADRAYMVKAFEVGGADYVTKPFLFEEVLARVRTHLALRQARAVLAQRSRVDVRTSAPGPPSPL